MQQFFLYTFFTSNILHFSDYVIPDSLVDASQKVDFNNGFPRNNNNLTAGFNLLKLMIKKHFVKFPVDYHDIP